MGRFKLHIVFILLILISITCSAGCSRAESDLLWGYTIGNDAYFTGISISPEGGLVAASSDEVDGEGKLYGYLYLFKSSGELLWKQETKSYSCNDVVISSDGNHVSISSDGNYIVTAGMDKVRLFNKSQELLWQHKIKGMSTVSISANGQYIAAGSASPTRGGCLYLLDNTGTTLWSGYLGEAYDTYVSVSSDGYMAAVKNWKKTSLYLFDRRGEQLWEREIGRVHPNCLSLSSDANYIAVSYQDIDEVALPYIIEDPPAEVLHAQRLSMHGEVCLFDRSGELLWRYDTEEVHSASISPEGHYIAAVVGDGELLLLDSKGELQGETYNPLGCISLSSHGDFIAGCEWGNLRLLDKKGELLWEYEASHKVADISISQDGCSIAAGSEDDYLYFFDGDGNLLWKYQTEDDIESVSISSDGNYVACGGFPSDKVYLLDSGGRLLWHYQLEDRVSAVCVEGNYAAAGSVEGSVYLLDIDGNLLWKKDTIDQYVMSVAVSTDGHLAAARYNRTSGGPYISHLYFWDRDGNLLWQHESGDAGSPEVVEVSSDGHHILSGTGAEGIYCFNESGKMLWNYRDPTDPTVLDLSISDGKIVALTGYGYLCFLDSEGELLEKREPDWRGPMVAVSSNSFVRAGGGNISLYKLD
jgi:WD40 repeat protein